LTDSLAKIQRLGRVARAFTPSAPIDDFELFGGRIPQIHDVMSAVVQKGQHVALYGERGVGKTSLANILDDLFNAPDLPEIRAVRVNCDSVEDFDSLWRKIYRELGIPAEDMPLLRPDDVRYSLAQLAVPAIVVLDELDRFDDNESLTLLADTIKTLSDHSVPSTVVLVGVASSVDGLIGEHESVARALVKIHMPRMRRDELRDTLEKGCRRARLGAQLAAAERIILLSQGLPHFTHLLALHAGQRAVQEDRMEIRLGDVLKAIPSAVEKHVVESDYVKATRSSHDSLYRPVLLACALAPQDEFGYFTAGSIREALKEVAGRPIAIPQFARHLKQFLEPARGSVLRREGEKHRYVYRFRDPIVQTYVVLHGLSSGLITEEQLEKLQGWQAMGESPTVPGRLF
jgi:Cdc6-like AAA superfamily ATPase